MYMDSMTYEEVNAATVAPCLANPFKSENPALVCNIDVYGKNEDGSDAHLQCRAWFYELTDEEKKGIVEHADAIEASRRRRKDFLPRFVEACGNCVEYLASEKIAAVYKRSDSFNSHLFAPLDVEHYAKIDAAKVCAERVRENSKYLSEQLRQSTGDKRNVRFYRHFLENVAK